MESLLLNPSAFSIVFENRKRIIASLILYLDGVSARVLTIAVHPSFRRRGLGRRLMYEAELMGKRLRQNKITLEVSTKNNPAINMYMKLGFRIEGVVENYYAWGEDAYTMTKRI